MSHLSQALRRRLYPLMVQHRVALVPDREGLIEAGDPAAIASGVPGIRLDEGNWAFAGRRKRLRLEVNGSQVTLRARHRPPPVDPEGDPASVRWASDRGGRLVAVCCSDPRTRTIHVLVDLGTAEVMDATEGIDPVGLLVDSFFSDTVAAWLQGASEPWVGPEVASRVRSLLAVRPRGDPERLREELVYLERLALADALPRSLADRIGLLTLALREPARLLKHSEPEPGDVDREVSRLERLILSRACGALRFSEGEIVGLLNPRRLERGWGVLPLMFRLKLEGPRWRTSLHIWNPLRSETGKGTPRCLGPGDLFIRDFSASGDLYCLVDLVLNFVETNRIGVFTLDGNEPSWSIGIAAPPF